MAAVQVRGPYARAYTFAAASPSPSSRTLDRCHDMMLVRACDSFVFVAWVTTCGGRWLWLLVSYGPEKIAWNLEGVDDRYIPSALAHHATSGQAVGSPRDAMAATRARAWQGSNGRSLWALDSREGPRGPASPRRPGHTLAARDFNRQCPADVSHSTVMRYAHSGHCHGGNGHGHLPRRCTASVRVTPKSTVKAKGTVLGVALPAKRGRDHLHGQLLPFPLARAVRPSIAYLPSPCSTRFISRRPLHITTVSHPSLKGRTPSSFLRAQSIRRRLQLASPFADPFLVPFSVSIVHPPGVMSSTLGVERLGTGDGRAADQVSGGAVGFGRAPALAGECCREEGTSPLERVRRRIRSKVLNQFLALPVS
ncbi:hypothetical protein HU200_026368 [Digitaria exilis]|uniref:Uncharacterized protein n=1 Tax=Digitaria exilis TaxID=1010633 RepID=A0A835BZK5_9POAL|nr:hypothetical protein HU200_026368 [Digitaria exilis]